MNLKAIILDIDGTLVNSKRRSLSVPKTFY